MGLTKCPDCGKDISDRAPTCPSCGRPMSAPEGGRASKPPLPHIRARPEDTALEKFGCKYPLIVIVVILALIILLYR